MNTWLVKQCHEIVSITLMLVIYNLKNSSGCTQMEFVQQYHEKDEIEMLIISRPTFRIRDMNDVPFSDNARSADSFFRNSTYADLFRTENSI